MKTLKKAFEEWADDAQFKVLASKSRTITERIFLKKYGSRDINEFDATLVKKILSESKEGKDVKIKATAALVHTLEFCAEKGECKQPAYTYSIVTDVTDVKSDDSQAAAKKPTPEAKPVIQLDADTLKPVKQWPSANSVKTVSVAASTGAIPATRRTLSLPCASRQDGLPSRRKPLRRRLPRHPVPLPRRRVRMLPILRLPCIGHPLQQGKSLWTISPMSSCMTS